MRFDKKEFSELAYLFALKFSTLSVLYWKFPLLFVVNPQ